MNTASQSISSRISRYKKFGKQTKPVQTSASAGIATTLGVGMLACLPVGELSGQAVYVNNVNERVFWNSVNDQNNEVKLPLPGALGTPDEGDFSITFNLFTGVDSTAGSTYQRLRAFGDGQPMIANPQRKVGFLASGYPVPEGLEIPNNTYGISAGQTLYFAAFTSRGRTSTGAPYQTGGNWFYTTSNNQTYYLTFQTNKNNFGWIKIRRNGILDITILAYAFELTPNTPITTALPAADVVFVTVNGNRTGYPSLAAAVTFLENESGADNYQLEITAGDYAEGLDLSGVTVSVTLQIAPELPD